MQEIKESNLRRWFALITVLRSGRRYSTGELARKFAVVPRTIYRDLQALGQMDVPVVSDHGRYWILESYSFKPIQLTAEEAFAMVTALDFARRNRALASKAAAQSALEKLRAVMPSSQRDAVAGLEDTFVVEPLPAHAVPSLPGIEATIHSAVQGEHPVRITYQALSASEPGTRIVEPYGLAYRGPALYLIGFCRLRQERRTFRVNRILKAEVLPAVCKRPKGFDLEDYLSEVWGIEDGPVLKIKLRFGKPVAALARDTVWHPKQKCTDQPDGSVILELETRGLNEVARWLAGYGGAVAVLAPPELQQAVAKLGGEIAALYGGGVVASGQE